MLLCRYAQKTKQTVSNQNNFTCYIQHNGCSVAFIFTIHKFSARKYGNDLLCIVRYEYATNDVARVLFVYFIIGVYIETMAFARRDDGRHDTNKSHEAENLFCIHGVVPG